VENVQRMGQRLTPTFLLNRQRLTIIRVRMIWGLRGI